MGKAPLTWPDDSVQLNTPPHAIKRVLVGTLADLCRTQIQAEVLLKEMDFPPQTRPRWDASAETYWRQVVRVLELGAVQGDGVRQLLETVLRHYPFNQDLQMIRDYLGDEQQERPDADGNADT
ncbi:effector-associated domain EAD1-containing protein [Streptomyces sp. SD15]